MKRLIPVFLILFFFAGCSSDQAAGGMIPKEDMIGLLTDIHIIDGYSTTINYDTANHVAPALYLSAFKKYGTDSAQFNKSLKYYSSYPKQLDEMYKQVKLRLEALQKGEEKRERQEAARAEKLRLQYAKRYTDSIKKAQEKHLQDSAKNAAFKQRSISK